MRDMVKRRRCEDMGRCPPDEILLPIPSTVQRVEERAACALRCVRVRHAACARAGRCGRKVRCSVRVCAKAACVRVRQQRAKKRRRGRRYMNESAGRRYRVPDKAMPTGISVEKPEVRKESFAQHREPVGTIPSRRRTASTAARTASSTAARFCTR